MTPHQTTEFTRPDAHPAKNVRRAGAPNNLMRSGEALMVGNTPTPRPAEALLAVAVFGRITSESHRFVGVDSHGRLVVSFDRLAVLVAELVTEHTADLTAQLDTVNDTLLDLLRDVDTLEGGEWQ